MKRTVLFSILLAAFSATTAFAQWKVNGEIARRELYRVDTNPVEHGRDIAAKNSDKVQALEEKLLSYLESVQAEKPQPKQPNKKRAKR